MAARKNQEERNQDVPSHLLSGERHHLPTVRLHYQSSVNTSARTVRLRGNPVPCRRDQSTCSGIQITT